MPALRDSDVMWRNFNVNVVAISKWSCQTKCANDCCQTKRQIQQDAWGSARIAWVSRQWLYDVYPQMIEKEQWTSNNSPIWMPWRYVWGATHEANLKPSAEAQSSFWIKSRTEEDMGQFSADSINKAVPSFRNNFTRVREGLRKTFWAFSLLKKCSYLRC